MLSSSPRLTLLLACTLLAGCSADLPVATPQVNRSPVGLVRDLREKQMQSTWVGQSVESLLQVFGTPGMVMDIPARRSWETAVVVYVGLDTASGCIDAFTVAYDAEPVINDYFCR
jgi:hypothetical protein